jgi:hypothetical protein
MPYLAWCFCHQSCKSWLYASTWHVPYSKFILDRNCHGVFTFSTVFQPNILIFIITALQSLICHPRCYSHNIKYFITSESETLSSVIWESVSLHIEEALDVNIIPRARPARGCLLWCFHSPYKDIFFFLLCVGVELSPPLLKLFAPATEEDDGCDDDDKHGAINRMLIKGTWNTLRTPAPVPLVPPQIPYKLTWAQTWVTTVGSWQLIAWATVQPDKCLIAVFHIS